MQVGDVASLHVATQLVVVVGEFDPVLLHDVAGSTDRGRSVVAMFHHVIPGTSHHEAGAGANVEGILSVATCSDDVDRLEFRQVDGHTHV